MEGLTAKYASALFDLAVERGLLSEYLAQAVSVRDVLQTWQSRGTMEHPHISAAEKRAFLRGVLPENVHADLIGFLHLLIANRHEDLMIPALAAFIGMGKKRDEIVLAHVVSAVGLREIQASALEGMLSKKLKKKVEISFRVDPLLIGGLTIYVDGLMIDHTIKRKLGNLRDAVIKGGAS
jgi:F-type H+-transporting ATPase subunit delta